MTEPTDLSEDSDAPPSAVQKPGRAVQRTAPGVLGAKDAPAQPTSLGTGDVVGGRFAVERYLGASGGGISYLCSDRQSDDPVVIKVLAMPFPGQQKFGEMAKTVRTASQIEQRNLTRILGMGRIDSGEVFVAMEFVKGSTLSSIIARRREEGRTLSVRDTFTVLAHACDALTAVHQRMTHGVLTPYNVYLDKHGVIKVGNLAFGRIAAEYLFAENGTGPFADSIYVAPEVAEDPDLMSSAADIYSLGMMAAELLSPRGLPADRDEAKADAIMMLSSFPSGLGRLVSRSIGEDLAARPKSAQAFREAFEKAARDMGATLTGPPPAEGLPVEPAVQEADDAEEDLFDIPELAGIGAEPSDPRHERYLVQKGGLDYGPFTVEQVLEQLHADEIDEFTPVLDRITQEREPLGEMAKFKKEVAEYIPIREERRRREAEARAELQRKVKKGGVGLLVAGIAAGLVLLGGQIYYLATRPDPTPLPLDHAFAKMDFNFLPPPKEFTAVAGDKDLLQNIFNPKASDEEIAKALKKRRRHRKHGRHHGGPSHKSKNGNVTEVDMSSGSGSKHILSDAEVNDVILANFGGLRSCILRELKRNSKFRGVTVQFFIRPTGTTGGVKIKEGKYDGTAVGDCITSRFRAMKFPEHSGFNRGVTYPLRVQY